MTYTVESPHIKMVDYEGGKRGVEEVNQFQPYPYGLFFFFLGLTV